MKPLYYDVWMENYALDYMEELHVKAADGRLDILKFNRVANKLMEWEEHYIQQFGQKCKDKNYLSQDER